MGENAVRILVVEDDEGHVGLIRRAFMKAAIPCRLTLAASIREANEYLRQEPFDLVLADLVLPTVAARNCCLRIVSRSGRLSS